MLKFSTTGATEEASPIENSAVSEIDSPAGAGSIEPNLSAGPDGRVYLSWLEPIQPKGYALKFSVRPKGGNWSTPRTITQGENRFDSSILALPDGSLAAYWLAKNGPGRHANDVTLSISRDGGQTWGKAIVPHRDRTPAERGFVSVAAANGGIAVVWIKGSMMMMDSASMKHGSGEATNSDASRHGSGDHKHLEGGDRHAPGQMAASKMESSLMSNTIGLDGTLGKEVMLDSRVCECCQTAAAQTPDGVAVVYRDRSDKEIRDISIVRLKNGKWSEPESLSKDGWEINGCPVNGPAISSSGKNVAVAWFTGAHDQPRVYAALSTDGGATFGPKVLLGDEHSIGRVDVIALSSGNAVVSWAERTPSGTEVRARMIRPDRSTAPAIVVAEKSSGASRMQMSGDEVIIAWTDSGDKSRVRTAILSTANK
jgi:hypothetical protein